MRPVDMTCKELDQCIARFTVSMQNAARLRIQDGRKSKAEADATLRRILERTDKARLQLRMCCVDGGRIRGWIEDTETDSISFQSSRTTDWWTVNDHMCTCPAYEAGNYCWHRPADRLRRMWWRMREERDGDRTDDIFEQVPPPRQTNQHDGRVVRPAVREVPTHEDLLETQRRQRAVDDIFE